MSSAPKSPISHNARTINIGRLVTKSALLFIIFNLIFSYFYPLSFLGQLSAYNTVIPGRLRLPYGDNPEQAYNLNLYNFEAMFASHEIENQKKQENEFRVILIGDSATWGYLLEPNQTAASLLNFGNHELPNGKKLRVYNLGYPVMSLTKDLLILDQAMIYQPDLIIWAVTLESFPYDKQLFPPLLQNNAKAVKSLIEKYDLKLDPNSSDLVEPDFWDRTIVGARRPLADLIRLQIYGIMWAATGIDHEVPETYTSAQVDLSSDLSFHNLQPPSLHPNQLALEILKTGFTVAGETPILLVNEPMLVSQGENSDIRYNFFYPRWVYDDYRQILKEFANDHNWQYIDLWNSIPASEFTNSAVHLSPVASQQYADMLFQAILELLQTKTATKN